MKIKSSRQGMNQKLPDVSGTVTLEMGRRAPRPRPAEQPARGAAHPPVSRRPSQRKGPADCVSVRKAATSIRVQAALPAWHSRPPGARASRVVAPTLISGSHNPWEVGGQGATNLLCLLEQTERRAAPQVALPCLSKTHAGRRAGKDGKPGAGKRCPQHSTPPLLTPAFPCAGPTSPSKVEDKENLLGVQS